MFLCHSHHQQSHEGEGGCRRPSSPAVAFSTLDSWSSPAVPGWGTEARGSQAASSSQLPAAWAAWPQALIFHVPGDSLACQGNAVPMQRQCRLSEAMQAQGKSCTQNIWTENGDNGWREVHIRKILTGFGIGRKRMGKPKSLWCDWRTGE